MNSYFDATYIYILLVWFASLWLHTSQLLRKHNFFFTRILTKWLTYSSRRWAGSTPFFLRTNRYRRLTSGQSRNNFSTSTLPINPVAPVISTFLPANHSGMLGRDDGSTAPTVESVIIKMFFIFYFCRVWGVNFVCEFCNTLYALI